MFIGCAEKQELTQLDFSLRASGANSAKAFRGTVHPILVQHCSSCHGNGGTEIKHSVTDYEEAHDVVVDGGKVNFDSPSKSRLVDKLISQNHNCWGGDCTTASNEMLAAIEKWIELRGVQESQIGSNVTKNLKFADAEKRIPETINGTVMLQAEDGELIGRMKVKSSSTASQFSYIAGDLPPVHPLEKTERIGEINTGRSGGDRCEVVSQTQLSETTNGRYRLRERARHFNDEGHRRYSQRIRIRLIRPDSTVRSNYINLLRNGQSTITDLNNMFLTEDAPEDGIFQGNIINANNGGTLRVLPEIMDRATYQSQILPESSARSREFFAPRFIQGVDPGDGSGNEYYNPTNEQIRAALPDEVKRDIVYEIVKESYRRLYFNSNGSLRRLNDIPYFLRFRGSTKLDPQESDATNRAVAETLLSEYFPLAKSDALDDVDGNLSDGSVVHAIDSYVQYYIDTNDRDFNNFSWSYTNSSGTPVTDSFSIQRNFKSLDLSSLFVDSGNVDERAIKAENFGGTLYNVLTSNSCNNCHGDGGGAPRHSSSNILESYDVAVGNVNFDEPSLSRFASRMDERHNCGSATNCSNIKTQIISAINDWKSQNATDVEAANAENEPKSVALSEKDRTVGRARYRFKVTEAGAYNVWLKAITTADKDRILLRILDEQGRPVDYCNGNQSCLQDEADYEGRTAQQIDRMHCSLYDLPNDFDVWTWWTPNIDNLETRRKWDLSEGTYTLEIIEQDIDAKIDLVAISKNPEFNPSENIIDEGLILSTNPRILKYDISEMIGSSGYFEIEIMEENGGDSYVFRNPQFVGLTENLKVSDVKILVNDTYEFANSAYTKIDAVVGAEPRILTSSSLVALSILGTGTDTFKFAFKDIKTTSAPLTKPEDDVPKPVEGRECLNLALFEETVMPILNRFRLMLKYEDGYQDYTDDRGDFPGTNRRAASNPTFYTCTTCHNEDHPYFKMTTFFDNSEVLCSQALSRVDFSNFEKSLLLRGINGTFNHPKLHFVERVDLTGSGNSRTFRKNSNKVNGFDSSWLGLRFDKYVRDNDENPNNNSSNAVVTIPSSLSSDDRAYLEKFIGQYQRAAYQRIDDPFAVRDGDILLPGDNYVAGPFDPENPDQWNYASSGTNEFRIIDPYDYLNRKGDLDPDSPGDGGLIVVDSDCYDAPFNDDGGIFRDTCNNGVDASAEFESVKTNYREAVINWMREEKKSYDAQ